MLRIMRKNNVFKILVFCMLFVASNTAFGANTFDFYKQNAMKYFNSGNYTKAAENFEQMKKWIPNDPNIYFNTALAYKNSNNPDKALLNVNKAIALSPKSVQYYRLAHFIYKDKAQFDKAYTAIEKAYNLNPEYQGVRYLYSEISAIIARDYIFINDTIKAEKYINTALKVATTSELLQNAAQIFLQEKQYQQAMIFYNKLLKINPQDRIALNNKKFIENICSRETAQTAINAKIATLPAVYTFPEKLYKKIEFKNIFFPETSDRLYKMLELIWNDEKGRILMERIVQKKLKIRVSGSLTKSNVYNSQQQYTYYAYGVVPIKFNANKVIEINLEERCMQLFFNNEVEPELRLFALNTLIHEFSHAVAATSSPILDNSIEEEMAVSMIGANITNRIIYGRDMTYDEVYDYSPKVFYTLLLDEHKELQLMNNFYDKMKNFESVIPPNSYLYRDLPGVYARMKQLPEIDRNIIYPELERNIR